MTAPIFLLSCGFKVVFMELGYQIQIKRYAGTDQVWMFARL